MDSPIDSRFTGYGAVGSRPSDPARLCCALTRLSQALAMSVPRIELCVALKRGVCECRGRRTEEIGWPSGDGVS